MTADDFRELALRHDGAVERAHMGHPDFRANGRIFASLQADGRRGMVKLAPEEQQQFILEHPSVFEPASGAWGRQGCTMVRLGAADPAAVRAALLLAWEHTSAPRRASRSHKSARIRKAEEASTRRTRGGSKTARRPGTKGR